MLQNVVIFRYQPKFPGGWLTTLYAYRSGRLDSVTRPDVRRHSTSTMPQGVQSYRFIPTYIQSTRLFRRWFDITEIDEGGNVRQYRIRLGRPNEPGS